MTRGWRAPLPGLEDAAQRGRVRGVAKLGVALTLFAWAAARAGAVEPVPTLRPTVHRAVAHDTTAFTQGLVWWDGKLYESTGRRGHSELRRIDPQTGVVERRVAIPVLFFGEGLARAHQRLAMLTWKAGQVFFFDLASLDRLPRTSRYRGEGWGLCHDGARYVMSDGSNRLTFRATDSFAPVGHVRVVLNDAPLSGLNELECVDDAVYANVFGEDYLVRVDKSSGRVTHRVDAAGLLDAEAARRADVLNGIAYDADAKRFYITGKFWPWIFEATFDPAPVAWASAAAPARGGAVKDRARPGR